MSECGRVLLIDPGMSTGFGHNLAYNRELAAAFIRRGREAVILAHEELGAVANSMSASCYSKLPWSFYGEFGQTAQGPLALFEQSARDFADALHVHADAMLEPGSLAVAHTMSPLGLLGLLFWRQDMPQALRPDLGINLMLGVDESEACAARLALCAGYISGQKEGVRLFGGTKANAALVEKIAGTPCRMLPSPLPEGMASLRISELPLEPVFGLQGDFRGGKNLTVLPAALLRYFKQGGQGRFSLPMPPIDASAHPVYLALHDISLAYPDRVALGRDYLAPEKYYANLAAYSAVLLPYLPCDYSVYRPSGLAVEAAVLGVPVIAAGGGFIEDELGPLNNGSLFTRDASGTALAEAMAAFELSAAERKARAMAAAYAYGELHSADTAAGMLAGL